MERWSSGVMEQRSNVEKVELIGAVEMNALHKQRTGV